MSDSSTTAGPSWPNQEHEGVAILAKAADARPGDGDGTTPTTEATTEEGNGDPTVEPTSDGSDDSGAGSFDDVPLPEGAEERDSGSFTSDQIPNADFDTGAFTTIEYREYNVDGTPEELLAFYSGELSDWTEVYKLDVEATGGAVAFGVWTRNDGAEALWAGASPDGESPQLVLILATSD